MFSLKFRIKSVDQYGYNGREYHPSAADEGLIVTAVRMDVWYANGAELTAEPVIGDDDRLYKPAIDLMASTQRDREAVAGTTAAFEDYLETCFTCVTADGRILELMNHEVEVVNG